MTPKPDNLGMQISPPQRRVFFIAGFDPKSPRYYHRAFRRLAAIRPEGAEDRVWGAVNVGDRRKLNEWADEWDISWPSDGGGPVQLTRVTLLRWDDIVREHWTRNPWKFWQDHWNFYVDGARQGNFVRLWHASRRNWTFVMFPLALLITWAALLAVLSEGILGHFMGLAAVGTQGAVGLTTAATCALSWPWISRRLGTDWLIRLYGFSHKQAERGVPGLESRVADMAAMVARLGDEMTPEQELMVVGHSTGATLAASVLSRALALAPQLSVRGPSIALLTLGQCTPLVYFFGTAGWLRAELDQLTAHARLTWIDYTAPADWAGCGEIPPWHAQGLATLRRLSPRFHRVLDIEHYRQLRRDRLAMHMQYLKPVDRAGGYDLLALIAGRPTLRERHSGHAHR